MTAIAIDDELIALQIIRSHAAKVPFLQLKELFTDAFKALEYLQKNPVDLIFLDIKMPDISGIEFYKSLPQKPLVIFTTAYQEHAVTSFELDAVDYLLKPFSLARFIKGCNKAAELFNLRRAGQPEDFVFIKTGTEQIRVAFSDILYLEAAGNYVTYFLNDRQVLSRSTVSEALETLPASQFMRVHRSFIVALNKITKVSRDEVQIGKKTIPVSEGYRQELNDFLKRQ
jgi:two-component system LytT family response regulator